MLKRVSVIVLVLLVLYIVNAFLFPFPKKDVPEGFLPLYGTSYSFEQAGWYGYDGRANFVKLLDDVKFDWVRLPFFWDRMISESGEFNKYFEDIEFAVSEAEKRNVKVVIALGLKTPYYPEYHFPINISRQVSFGQTIGAGHPIADKLLEIDNKVVSRLSKYENITYWQIENEPFLANVNNWKIEKSLIKEEIKVVRETDPDNRPIIINHVGPAVFDRKWKQLVDVMQPGDVFGVNAYFKTQGINLFAFGLFGNELKIPWPRWLIWPVQSWYFLSPNYETMKKELAVKNINLWVLEMQAEPYVNNLEYAASGNYSFTVSDIERALTYLKNHRVESIGLWGANFWIYREKMGDYSWIDEVKKTVN